MRQRGSVSYQPRHAAGRSGQQAYQAHIVPVSNSRTVVSPPQPFHDNMQARQIAGLNALLTLSYPITATPTVALPSLAPTTQSRVLRILKDPALRGALALMLSAVLAGGLGFVFWALTTHHQKASAFGSVSAEVSSITFLAIVGSLNLTSIFARFLPVAGWSARRLILTSYAGVFLAGLLAAAVFLSTPFATGLILGGRAGRIAFIVCVMLNSVFNIQDGGLIGFGKFGWVPIENSLVAMSRLVLLPLSAIFFSAQIGILWSWALPMGIAVMVVNIFVIGPLAGRHMDQSPRLPTVRELSSLVAIDSVTTAIYAAVGALLPALVTRRLGATMGGYFYVPWIVATMVSLLLTSILISMVREAVARPQKAAFTIRRSIGLALLVVGFALFACLFLPHVILAPLGSSFADHGAPLLRWVGFATPATAVIVLFWAVCLVRRRPWPVFAVNLATSGAILGGIFLLNQRTDIARVGIIYCSVQWAAAIAVSVPTSRELRLIRLGIGV